MLDLIIFEVFHMKLSINQYSPRTILKHSNIVQVFQAVDV